MHTSTSRNEPHVCPDSVESRRRCFRMSSSWSVNNSVPRLRNTKQRFRSRCKTVNIITALGASAVCSARRFLLSLRVLVSCHIHHSCPPARSSHSGIVLRKQRIKREKGEKAWNKSPCNPLTCLHLCTERNFVFWARAEIEGQRRKQKERGIEGESEEEEGLTHNSLHKAASVGFFFFSPGCCGQGFSGHPVQLKRDNGLKMEQLDSAQGHDHKKKEQAWPRNISAPDVQVSF